MSLVKRRASSLPKRPVFDESVLLSPPLFFFLQLSSIEERSFLFFHQALSLNCVSCPFIINNMEYGDNCWFGSLFLNVVLIRGSSAEVSDWKTSPGEKLYSHLVQNDETKGGSSHNGLLACLDKCGSTSGIFMSGGDPCSFFNYLLQWFVLVLIFFFFW